jgi:pyridoxine/pyridoxamine 5'-phosphate oxidase
MSESHFHPEQLNDDRLWGMYSIETQNMEHWRDRAQRTLAELVLRGLIVEYPTYGEEV